MNLANKKISLLAYLGGANVLFLVNVYFPLFLNSTNQSERFTTFTVCLIGSILAYKNYRIGRISVVVLTIVIAFSNFAVGAMVLINGSFYKSLFLVSISLVSGFIAFKLLSIENTSKSETANPAFSQI